MITGVTDDGRLKLNWLKRDQRGTSSLCVSSFGGNGDGIGVLNRLVDWSTKWWLR